MAHQDRRRQVPAEPSAVGDAAPLVAATPPAPVDVTAVLNDAAELNIAPVQQVAQTAGAYIPIARVLPDRSNDNNNNRNGPNYKQMRAARGEGLGHQRGKAMKNQQKAMQQAPGLGKGGPVQPLDAAGEQQRNYGNKHSFAF